MMFHHSSVAVLLAALLVLKYDVSAFEQNIRGALVEEQDTNKDPQDISPGRARLAANEKASVRSLQAILFEGGEDEEQDDRELDGKKKSKKKKSKKKKSKKKRDRSLEADFEGGEVGEENKELEELNDRELHGKEHKKKSKKKKSKKKKSKKKRDRSLEADFEGGEVGEENKELEELNDRELHGKEHKKKSKKKKSKKKKSKKKRDRSLEADFEGGEVGEENKELEELNDRELHGKEHKKKSKKKKSKKKKSKKKHH